MSATVYTVALRAFPAAILGGLDSTGGALVGGLLIGMAESFAAGYQDQLLFLGRGFGDVVPYIVMIARPPGPAVRALRHQGADPCLRRPRRTRATRSGTRPVASPPRRSLLRPVLLVVALVVMLALPALRRGVLAAHRVRRVRRDRRRDRAEPARRDHGPAVARPRVLPRRRRRHLRLRLRRVGRHRAGRPQRSRLAAPRRHDRGRARSPDSRGCSSARSPPGCGASTWVSPRWAWSSSASTCSTAGRR